MSYNVGDLKNDLEGTIHSTNLNKVHNILNLIWRAGRDVLNEADPKETIRIEQITNALYDQVYRYTAPTDLKGSKIIDIRPQTDRSIRDVPRQVFNQDFDARKGHRSFPKFTIEHDSGTKTLKIDNPTLTAGVLVHPCNSITANGTWSAGGDATNLTADTLTYLTGSASLNFDISGTSGYLENSDFSAVDLEDEEDNSSVFFWLYIPDADTFTSAEIRWGSSSTAYWSRTLTAPHNSSSVEDGWNLFRSDWNGATETGSPDSSAIDYLRITLNATTDTDYRLENIMVKKGYIYDVVYYSKYLFRTEAGVWQEEPENDLDEINLDTESYNLLLYRTALLTAQQIQAEESDFDTSFYRREWLRILRNYKQDNKSESLAPQSQYYRL